MSPLFHVQDSDRPLWIVARDFGHAVEKWRDVIRRENNLDPSDNEDMPTGVQHVCDDDDFVGGSTRNEAAEVLAKFRFGDDAEGRRRPVDWPQEDTVAHVLDRYGKERGA